MGQGNRSASPGGEMRRRLYLRQNGTFTMKNIREKEGSENNLLVAKQSHSSDFRLIK